MLRRIPQIGTDLIFDDIYSGYVNAFAKRKIDFAKDLSRYLSSDHAYLVNSGTAAFYIILEALKGISRKKKIILPSYTAPAMVLPILKAGLKTVLCDISLKDFNMDLNLLPSLVSEETLAIVPTHMFGITIDGIDGLR